MKYSYTLINAGGKSKCCRMILYYMKKRFSNYFKILFVIEGEEIVFSTSICIRRRAYTHTALIQRTFTHIHNQTQAHTHTYTCMHLYILIYVLYIYIYTTI